MDDPVVVHVPVASPGTMWRLARLSTASPGTMWLIECAHLTADTSCTIRHLTSDCENGYCITCVPCMLKRKSPLCSTSASGPGSPLHICAGTGAPAGQCHLCPHASQPGFRRRKSNPDYLPGYSLGAWLGAVAKGASGPCGRLATAAATRCSTRCTRMHAPPSATSGRGRHTPSPCTLSDTCGPPRPPSRRLCSGAYAGTQAVGHCCSQWLSNAHGWLARSIGRSILWAKTKHPCQGAAGRATTRRASGSQGCVRVLDSTSSSRRSQSQPVAMQTRNRKSAP